MPSKKKNKGGGGSGGLFSCFGGGTDDQPEIRYEPENGAPQIWRVIIQCQISKN